MPSLLDLLLLLPPAALIAYEDFRMREVAVVWLAWAGAAALVAGALAVGLGEMLWRVGVNGAVLCLLCGVLLLYLRLRGMRVRRAAGAGDVVALCVVTPLFGPVGYVRFLLVAGVAALVWWAAARPTTIPFAGFVALSLAVYAVFNICVSWN